MAGEPDSPIARLLVRLRDEGAVAEDQRQTDQALAPFMLRGEG